MLRTSELHCGRDLGRGRREFPALVRLFVQRPCQIDHGRSGRTTLRCPTSHISTTWHRESARRWSFANANLRAPCWNDPFISAPGWCPHLRVARGWCARGPLEHGGPRAQRNWCRNRSRPPGSIADPERAVSGTMRGGIRTQSCHWIRVFGNDSETWTGVRRGGAAEGLYRGSRLTREDPHPPRCERGEPEASRWPPGRESPERVNVG